MTNKERQIIIDSIVHWENDVIERHEQNIHCDRGIFADNYIPSKENCPLCKEYYNHRTENCNNCLWVKSVGEECYRTGEAFELWRFECCIKNAKKVVEQLWIIGTNNKKFCNVIYYSYD